MFKNLTKQLRRRYERKLNTMNENLTPSHQVRQKAFATLREAKFEGETNHANENFRTII